MWHVCSLDSRLILRSVDGMLPVDYGALTVLKFVPSWFDGVKYTGMFFMSLHQSVIYLFQQRARPAQNASATRIAPSRYNPIRARARTAVGRRRRHSSSSSSRNSPDGCPSHRLASAVAAARRS